MTLLLFTLTWAFLSAVDAVRAYVISGTGHEILCDDHVFRMAFFHTEEDRHLSANRQYIRACCLHGMFILAIGFITYRLGAVMYTKVLVAGFVLKSIASYLIGMMFYIRGRIAAMGIIPKLAKRTPVPDTKRIEWSKLTDDQKVMVGWASSPDADWVAYTMFDQVMWMVTDILMAGMCLQTAIGYVEFLENGG